MSGELLKLHLASQRPEMIAQLSQNLRFVTLNGCSVGIFDHRRCSRCSTRFKWKNRNLVTGIAERAKKIAARRCSQMINWPVKYVQGGRGQTSACISANRRIQMAVARVINLIDVASRVSRRGRRGTRVHSCARHSCMSCRFTVFIN